MMRHFLSVILLIVLVLVAMLSGCGGAHRYDGRLTAADSLLRSNPDSALTLVEAVSRDSLPDEGDRAYRDLLLTQARYRCYVTATSDSDINRALAWFRAHPAEREKLTRALIYKGAVMEELNHPDSAMLYYKQAEANADPDDYFNLGYVNLRIGRLYRDINQNDSAVVSRMRNATSFFDAVGDTNNLIITIGNQGLYENVVGKDSAIHYLEKAIRLGKDANSSKRYYYQSKLAGTCFYGKNYVRAKDLALDIIANGKEACEENTFYYYAARSYIKLNQIDSALWIKSMIPEPLDAVDSMNHHLLLSDLAQATNDYRGYAHHSHQAHMIDERITDLSFNSNLSKTELDFDAQLRETLLVEHHHFNIIRIALAFLLIAAILISCGIMTLRKMNHRYEKQLKDLHNQLNELINEIGQKDLVIKSERDEHQRIIAQKNHELHECNWNIQKNISARVSDIARFRQTALNELQQNLRVQSVSEDGRKRYLPFSSLLKDLLEKREILHKTPKKTFWNKLMLSVDGEFDGIASFVQQHYPSITEKEMHLFLLVCASIPNPIIKLCMGYTSDVTVSKNKKRLMKERFGLDVKFDDFIQMYLQDRLGH